ncbi:MAG: hypothetical protein ACRDRS_00785 [Pseudonocardiaceae bacterium]
MNDSEANPPIRSEVRGRPSPWRWRRGENPYRYTAFNVLGLDPAPRKRRSFLAQVARRVQRAQFGELSLFGRRLDESEVHGAEQRLQNATDRVFEELRTHRPHPVQLVLNDLSEQLGELEPTMPSRSPEIMIDRAMLARLAPPPRARHFDPLPKVATHG